MKAENIFQRRYFNNASMEYKKCGKIFKRADKTQWMTTDYYSTFEIIVSNASKLMNKIEFTLRHSKIVSSQNNYVLYMRRFQAMPIINIETITSIVLL